MIGASEPLELTLGQQVAVLSGHDAWRTEAVPEHGARAVVVADGPHGMRVLPEGHDAIPTAGSLPATCFPPAVTMASTWDEPLIEAVGAALAREAAALGVDVVLGPGLNIKRHPRGGRNFEYYSEDPLLSGRFAAAAVRGLQSQGVGGCLKHFAVNNQESHRFVVDAIVDERTLRELYLAGFEYAVTHARPWTVMCSYNRLNGEQVSEHRGLLTTILREEWGFDGLVMSDWAATADRGVGVRAGLDLEMPSSSGLSDAETIRAVMSGDLPIDAVLTSVRRLLDLAERAQGAEADRPAVAPSDTGGNAGVGGALAEESHQLARTAAAAGTVLLTNNGILPLAATTRVAVIGAFATAPRYQGNGSSAVVPTRIEAALKAFTDRFDQVSHAAGYHLKGPEVDPTLIAEAATLAAEADVAIVMVGLPGHYESEGFDRDHLELPVQHNRLVEAVCAANPNTVVALSNGSPVLMPWHERPAAILESYLGGQASGAALVDVLLGEAEPGGRLAETFPARAEDISAEPFFDQHPRQALYREGLFVGYRHAVTAEVAPLFPFGHGLSYTTFEWADFAADREVVEAGERVEVSLTVTNIGERPGSEVVQVYRHDRSGVVLRPRRELVGFAKVRLEPGEQRTVRIPIPERAFEFYDVVGGGWQRSRGRHDLEIARSSIEVLHTIGLEVAGGVTASAEPPQTPAISTTDDAFRARLGRPIPTPDPVRPFTRNSTIEELRESPAGRLFASLLWRMAPLEEEARTDEALKQMYQRSFQELPIRSAAIFSQGKLTWPVVDALLAVFNASPRRSAASAYRRARDGVSRLRSARQGSH